MTHDERFKLLLKARWADFIRLFFGQWADRFDFSTTRWLEQELIDLPPMFDKGSIDLLAEVQVREPPQVEAAHSPGPWPLHVHVEIESADRSTEIRERMPDYNRRLKRKLKKVVLPIALFLRVGLGGISSEVLVERVWDFEVSRFQYLYVGLPALPAEQYVRGDNLLGVALASLMNMPPDQVARLGAEALGKITAANVDRHDKLLLADCVEAYLPLDEPQRMEFERLLRTETYQGVAAMNKTSYDKGLEEGLEEGLEAGERRALCWMLLDLASTRFGFGSPALEAHLKTLTTEQLRRLARDIALTSSFDDLKLPR